MYQYVKEGLIIASSCYIGLKLGVSLRLYRALKNKEISSVSDFYLLRETDRTLDTILMKLTKPGRSLLSRLLEKD